MTWVAVGVGVVSAIGGIAGNNKSAKLQKQALALQQDIQQHNQRDELNFNKQRYEDYNNQYGGIIDLVVKGAEKGVDPNLGQVTSEASADTATAFKNSHVALDNQNQRLGINPNSGRAESFNRNLSLSQALATAGNVTNARNTERKNATDQTWNRRFGVYQQGNSLINGTANNISNIIADMSKTTANAANQQSQWSNQAITGGISAITGGLLDNYTKSHQPTIKDQTFNGISDAIAGMKLTDEPSGILKQPVWGNE